MINETKNETLKRRFLLESGSLKRPHPLRNLPERLGRSPGRSPLPDMFEQYLRDQIVRQSITPPNALSLLPSRDLCRGRRRPHARRPDA